jgi:TolB-like protein
VLARLIAVSTLLAALPTAGAEPAAARRPKIAVMEIRALAMEKEKADLLSEIALTEVSSTGAIDAIGHSEIVAVLGFEKQKQMAGCAEDSSCVAEIGGALGADYLLIGSLGRLGNLFRIDLKLVETKRARVRNRVGETVEEREEKLIAAVQRSVRALVDPVAQEAKARAARAQGSSAAVTAPAAAPAPAPVPAAPAAALATPPAVAVATPAPIPPEPQRTAPEPAARRRTWSFVAGGAGLVAVAGGVVMGLQANQALSDEKKASSANDLKGYDAAASRAKSRAQLADVLYGVGAVGLGAGAYLYFSRDRAAVAVLPAPGGAVASFAWGF